jgi:beta-lactamase superfamily II metal-dependent hydrolase
MKWNIRLLILLLTLCTLCASAVACGSAEPVEETTVATTTTVAETTAATEPVEEMLDIVVDGKAQYAIVRDEDLSTSAAEIDQSLTILNRIKTLTNASVNLGTDWWKKGAELKSETHEILVGYTDYPETAQVIDSLKYGEYAIRAVGNKIVIFGFDTASLGKAVSEFNTLLSKGVSEDGKSISLSAAEIETQGVNNKQLTALPLFEGGSFGAYYEAGGNCDEIIVRNTTPELYRSYLTKLESEGYKKYTEHEIAGNLFATYTNDKYTVTAGYYDYETSVRLLIEPLAPAVGLKEDNVYTAVTTPQLTMLGQEYTKSNGDLLSNGQSILIRCADGRFIIVDGGHNTAAIAAELRKALISQSSEYAKTTKDITIAAWIVTHAHGDHFGLLVNRYNEFKDMTVEKILVNFLSETERSKAASSTEVGKNWSLTEGNAYTKVPPAAKALGAEVHQIHVGQVFYVADVTMEVIYTIESFAPNVCNALNTSSTVMKMDIAGTSYMSTGDATGNGMEICAKMYGDYMQSDIVQVCHHGGTTWGNDAGMIKAYTIINAPTVIWPRGLTNHQSSKTAARNAILYKVPNYKEDYVSGAVGDVVILPMPYTVGTGSVTRVK